MMSPWLPQDQIRDLFSRAMSEMYRQEVPQYGTLVELVETVNREVLDADPALAAELEANGELARLDVERHGAIRVGTPEELAMLRRLFAVMGMYPVGYYDLSVAGVPVHSTAFRPVDDEALKRNPFRVFTSLLRLELIEQPELRERAAEVLAGRDIFTPDARQLIETAEAQGGLDEEQARHFVDEALETFRWHRQATVDLATYQALSNEHRLIADVVCFRGPHINHLTPRTLDIDEVQRRMPRAGIDPKAIVEGPPRRDCPILLRQTSFKALEESITFAGNEEGSHTARFGEIEQRGVALTRRGRALYDSLLNASRKRGGAADNDAHQAQLAQFFRDFPDSHDLLRREGLAFYHYRAVPGRRSAAADGSVEALIEAGALVASPITYEDFLPVSAAGIFQSNLGDGVRDEYASHSNQAQFEEALGVAVTDELALYERRQEASLKEALASLG
ncbi:2-oxoadipate dioxygenase/decarboxylase HglS [Billgrantia kenyensis]|uniref:2-oxoadipate dioxygenase/decarboxylase n=1 Tax=Billgrantia kenyensis TaxID=321266 RepID=A0A7W0ADW9_9GAMM|nr:VOC family protein [Halomonas kenyensis]MBA2779483.1 VOC family protein [Halomonas kenyensis]MCG6662716.1 VOC family protein [Halomonas kenyensis]